MAFRKNYEDDDDREDGDNFTMVRCDNALLVRQTEKAALIRFEDGTEGWSPWAAIDDNSDLETDGDEGTVYLWRKIAEQHGVAYIEEE